MPRGTREDSREPPARISNSCCDTVRLLSKGLSMGRIVKLCTSRVISWSVALILLVFSVTMLHLRRDRWGDYWDRDFAVSPSVVVISSDDWNGTMESVNDLRRLEAMLVSLVDHYGRHPIVTAYMIPSKVDFEQVIRSDYHRYAWKSSYAGRPEITDTWRRLKDNGLVEIQLHGREHFNVPLWLSLLQHDSPGFRQACREGHMRPKSPALSHGEDQRFRYFNRSFIDASVWPPKSLPLDVQARMIQTGARLIEDHLGIKPEVFVASGHVWDTRTYRALRSNGIQYIETRRQEIMGVGPSGELKGTGRTVKWFGSPDGLLPVIRNTGYEPMWGLKTGLSNQETVDLAVAKARSYLSCGIPLVLRTHAGNYVSGDLEVRKQNMRGLKTVLQRLQAEYSHLAFLSASDLAKYMHANGKGSRRSIPFEIRRVSHLRRLVDTATALWLAYPHYRWTQLLLGFWLLWSILISVPFVRAKLRVGGQHARPPSREHE